MVFDDDDLQPVLELGDLHCGLASPVTAAANNKNTTAILTMAERKFVFTILMSPFELNHEVHKEREEKLGKQRDLLRVLRELRVHYLQKANHFFFRPSKASRSGSGWKGIALS